MLTQSGITTVGIHLSTMPKNLTSLPIRDDVEWDEAKEAEAEQIIASQTAASPLLHQSSDISGEAPSRWDAFYSSHERSFFKDRNWLVSEFPELFVTGRVILEVGCGAGNTSFPILRERTKDGVAGSDGLFLYSSDFSQKAVDLVKEHPEYNPTYMHAFLHDLALDPSFEPALPDASVDVIVAIFVFSALDPQRLPFAFAKLFKALKPGGLLLFRDYGRHDMTQLRFKPARMVRGDGSSGSDNLYLRGDGTAVHYFEAGELGGLAEGAGFQVLVNQVDRRLLVNRQRRLTMYRIWMQAKFQKPL